MSIEAETILRQKREQKGVSINEASDTLHIRIPYLQALENGRAEIIPSAVQARGFLRIYAEYLGIDPIEIIQEWDHPGSSSLSSEEPPAEADSSKTGKASEDTAPRVPVSEGAFPPPVSGPLPPELFSFPGLTPDPKMAAEMSSPAVPETESAAAPVPVVSGTETGSKDTGKSKHRSLFGGKKKEAHPPKEKELSAQDLFDNIGQQLSSRRKFLSLSIEDCESQTLIRSIYIESMENGNFEQLPSFIQARGMLNNYASFLDLDVDEIMLKLATALQLLSQKKNNRGDGKKRKPTRTAGRLKKFFTPDLFVGVFVIVGIAGIIIYSAITIAAYRRNYSEPTPDLGISMISQYLPSTPSPAVSPTPVITQASPFTSSVSEETEGDTTEESQEFISSQPIQLFVTANQRTLMTVISDGKEVFSGRTLPNHTYPFDAGTLIELTAGNADAISVVYNQQNLGRLGKIGEVITIDFSPYMAATPTPRFSPTPTNTYEPTYTPQPETPLPTNTPTPYIP